MFCSCSYVRIPEGFMMSCAAYFELEIEQNQECGINVCLLYRISALPPPSLSESEQGNVLLHVHGKDTDVADGLG